MKHKTKEIVERPPHEVIKVQLDHRTFITVLHEASIKMWLLRFPNAKVIKSK